jgi:hypothetical protein
MAIIGAHMLLYSSQADRLRALLGDAFGLKSVDAGHGWLIFSPPPAEVAVHPEEPFRRASPTDVHVYRHWDHDHRPAREGRAI